MYDVIIIGAGSAGLAALREVQKRTDNFLMINHGPYGTTCARVGCMPSKALIEAAHAYHRRHDLAAFGVDGADRLSIDIPAVMRRTRELRDGFVAGTLKATDELGDRNLQGKARLESPDTVVVDGRRFQGRAIILAPGSSPIVPAPWRALGQGVLTTDNLFELPDLPRRLAVVGLGAIGAEMAQAAAHLGVEVTGFERLQTLAGVTDPEVNQAVVEALGRDLTLHLGAAAEVEASGGGFTVTAGDARAEVDGVLVALGRRPNVQDLGLEALGVVIDDRGMPEVNPETLQLGDLPVFLAGDANGQSPILHEAADDGHIAGLNATGGKVRRFPRRVPLGIVFMDPQVAAVGRRFDQLELSATAIGKVSFARHGRARMARINEGVLRVYANKADGRLLGAELCAPAGEHLAHLLALAIEGGLTVHQMLRLPFYHPVLEEGLRAALRRASREVPPCGDSDLAGCGGYGIEALD
jgi:dihydrolipoamide dehydrogenase